MRTLLILLLVTANTYSVDHKQVCNSILRQINNEMDNLKYEINHIATDCQRHQQYQQLQTPPRGFTVMTTCNYSISLIDSKLDTLLTTKMIIEQSCQQAGI